ncbi:MAG: ATP-binding protein [Bacteroidia bacterium]
MRSFRLGILLRVLLLSATTIAFIFFAFFQFRYIGASMFVVMIGLEIYHLYTYVEGTNRKLTRFLNSIEYADFETGFVADNQLGRSFRELNDSFAQVVDSFRDIRAEGEEHLQYLNTVVRHVDIGLISYDQDGKVELLNSAACRLLNTQPFTYLSKLKENNPEVFQAIHELETGSSALVKNENGAQLVIYPTDLKLRDRQYRLLSIKNIEQEMQAQELEAWQKLAVALRHEIVNSVTPIASIIDTLNEIIDSELDDKKEVQTVNQETVADIKEALHTIRRRGHGLIRFVNAYKDFTRIPQPDFQRIQVQQLLNQVQLLVRTDMENEGIDFQVNIPQKEIPLMADPDLLEMVLLNLIKNAREALKGREGAQIILECKETSQAKVEISVTDNGPGIIPQAINKIFTPFYSTKSKSGGTGVGLSISKRIIQMHQGTMTVESAPNEKTVFLLRF